LNPHPRLLIDLRQFEIATSPSLRAVIAFSVKLVDAAGHLKRARIFEQSAPLDTVSPPEAAAALDKVFGTVARPAHFMDGDGILTRAAALDLGQFVQDVGALCSKTKRQAAKAKKVRPLQNVSLE
jgi:hypothetical protein